MSAQALSVQEQQYWLNMARAAGYKEVDIQNFLADNGPLDLPRIMSALAPNPGPSGALAVVFNPKAVAVPAPLAGSVGDILTVAPSDSTIRGTGDGFTGPYLIHSGSPQDVIPGPGGAPTSIVLPASGIPGWAILLAVGILIFLFMERR